MPRQPPNHRALKIAEQLARGEEVSHDHPFDSALFHALRTGDCPISIVEEAAQWHSDDGMRHLLDALYIGKCPAKEIAIGLDLDPAVLGPYEHLFFDRTVFRHALDVLRYSQDVEPPADMPILKEYYDVAVKQGPQFLLNRFRIGARPIPDPKAMLDTIAHDQMDRFLSHRGQTITSETAREAFKWGQAAVSTAGALLNEAGKKGSKDAFQKLKILLQVNDQTTTMEAEDITPDQIAP